jgi:arylsulfatase A
MKKKFLSLIVLASVLIIGLTNCSSKLEYPNIIFILADDLGYGDPGCYNADSKIPTPNMDKLASQGMRFTDAHTPSTVCSPTRYAVLTGRYAWREPRLVKNVLRANDKPVIETERKTVADLLKEKGYQTAAVGKWHLGLQWQLIESDKPVTVSNIDWSKPQLSGIREQGFDYTFSLGRPAWTFTENGVALAEPVEKFDLYKIGPHLIGPNNIKGYRASDYEHEKMLPVFTQKAVEFIKNNSGSRKPFFLYFSPMCPHKPVVPNEKFVGQSEAGLYGDFVAELDHSVGQILNALDNASVSNNTLIFFTSDNGPEKTAYERIINTNHYSMNGLRGVKRDLWEGGHRIPFIVRWPGKIPASSVNHETICLVDFMATVAAITGYDLSAPDCEDSYNILPALLGETQKDPLRDAIVHHAPNSDLAIRKGDWVFIDAASGDINDEPVWFREERGAEEHYEEKELFNLAEDPQQITNLYSAFPRKAEEMRNELVKIINVQNHSPAAQISICPTLHDRVGAQAVASKD